MQEKEFYILLDILFSEIPYVETIEKEVKNELLIVDGLKTMVTVPSAEYIKGIKAVGTHILFLNYSGEIVAHQACKVMYLAACLLKEKEFVKIEHPEAYIAQKNDQKNIKGYPASRSRSLKLMDIW